MYTIRNARVASVQEKIEVFKSILGKGNAKKDFSYDYCIKNESLLQGIYMEFYNNYRLKKYNEYKDQIVEANAKRLEFKKSRQQAFYEASQVWDDILDSIHEKNNLYTCSCGGSLRYVESHNFIGCTNYRDFTQKHFSLNRPVENQDPIYLQEVEDFDTWESTFEFSKLYLHYFKQDYGLPKDLMQSILYEFLHGIWKLPKVCHDLTSEYFTTGHKVNSRSKKEEQIIYKILKSKFDTVLDQPMIFYNIDGDKQTVCFPDFICSNDKTILVIDVKKDPTQVDDDRLIKYDQLVKFICQKYGINKEVITKYYFYDVDDYCIGNVISEAKMLRERNGITLKQISDL